MTGDALLLVLVTLVNPHRMRIVATLADERNDASRRDLGISRALLHFHLRKLETAGLGSASVEVSAGGMAMECSEVAPFALH